MLQGSAGTLRRPPVRPAARKLPVQSVQMLGNRSVRLATGVVACVAGTSALYLWGPRVHRPPAPAAARLPASARILLQPFRKDSLELTVAPQEELNYRVGMQAGATLVYAWSAAPKGEKLAYEFADRETGTASDAHSAIVAQSSGWYRWRWKNQNGRPVTIHLKLSGYYEPANIPAPGAPYDR
jgi:hypothetical protein